MKSATTREHASVVAPCTTVNIISLNGVGSHVTVNNIDTAHTTYPRQSSSNNQLVHTSQNSQFNSRQSLIQIKNKQQNKNKQPTQNQKQNKAYHCKLTQQPPDVQMQCTRHTSAGHHSNSQFNHITLTLIAKGTVATSLRRRNNVSTVLYTAKCQPNSKSSQSTAYHERVWCPSNYPYIIVTRHSRESVVCASTCTKIMSRRQGCSPKCWETSISETSDSPNVSCHRTAPEAACSHNVSKVTALKWRSLMLRACSISRRGLKMSRRGECTPKCWATDTNDRILHALRLDKAYVALRPSLWGEGVPSERPLALSAYILGLKCVQHWPVISEVCDSVGLLSGALLRAPAHPAASENTIQTASN